MFPIPVHHGQQEPHPSSPFLVTTNINITAVATTNTTTTTTTTTTEVLDSWCDWLLPGEGYKLGSNDQWLWSINGMKIVMGKPKELGEKYASSILTAMNFT